MNAPDLNTSDQLAIIEEYIEKDFLKSCDILTLVKEQHAAMMASIDIKYTAILKEIQVCRYEIDIVKEMLEEQVGQEEEETGDSQSEGEENVCTEEPPLTQYANGEEEIYVIPKKRRLNTEKKS